MLDAFFLIVRYGKQIDVLQLFHLKFESIFVGLIYRMINRKGILYLKLDMNPEIIRLYEGRPQIYYDRSMKRPRWRSLLAYPALRLISLDIIGVETRELYQFMRMKHPLFKKFADRICYVPNGVDSKRLSPLIVNFEDKESIILHVGRIGSYQKGSDVVLEAFAGVSLDFPNWRLLLIGRMENEFADYLRDFRSRGNETIRDKIVYVGSVERERERLYEYYGKATILAFPSRFESFGFVAVEAGFFGDVILGTNIPSVREITNDGKFGCLCPVDDVKCFTETLRYALSHENYLKEKSESIKRFIMDNFDWNKICRDLHENIRRKLKDR